MEAQVATGLLYASLGPELNCLGNNVEADAASGNSPTHSVIFLEVALVPLEWRGVNTVECQ